MNRLLTIAMLLLTTPAVAADCIELASAKRIVAAEHGRWIELTDSQWQFMRGAFYANPKTAERLPFGDSAALGTSDAEKNAMVFFIDGDRACDMLALGKDGLAVLLSVGSGALTHEGKGP